MRSRWSVPSAVESPGVLLIDNFASAKCLLKMIATVREAQKVGLFGQLVSR
jgi:hypothetical protein